MIVSFKSFYIVRHWGISDAPSPVDVTVDGVSLRFSVLEETDLKPFRGKDDWRVETRTTKEVTDRTGQKFNSDGYSENQRVINVSREELSRAHVALLRFLKAVRWRLGFIGHDEPIRCTVDTAMLSTDGTNWRPVPRGLTIASHHELYAHPYSESLFDELDKLLQSNYSEPMAHEIWREAWNLCDRSPRASLMLGLSALEVGVKEYIANTAPHARWLCEEVPTPPIEKMLREYLPTLPSSQQGGNSTLRIADAVLRDLKTAINFRNKVVHRGEDVRNRPIREWLKLVRGVLYTLDVHRGHSWAKRHAADVQLQED